MPSSVVSAVAGGAASSLVGGLMGGGGGTPRVPQPFNNINSTGFSTTRDGRESLTLNRTGEVSDLLSAIQSGSTQAAQELSDIRLNQLKPGFGDLSQTTRDVFGDALRRLRERRDTTIGDMRENFARRRLAGSSFASDAETRRELEFSRAEQELLNNQRMALAGNFLQELDFNTRLIQDELNTSLRGYEQALAQTNQESNIAASIATGTQSTLASIGQTNAQLAAQAAQGAGQFFQPVVDQVGSSVSNWVGGLFDNNFDTAEFV